MNNEKLALKIQILKYLLEVKQIKKKNLRVVFKGYDYSHYLKTLKLLIKEDYINSFKFKKAINIKITKKGIEYLKKHYDFSINKRESRVHLIGDELRRHNMLTSVSGICKANNILTSEFCSLEKLYYSDEIDDVIYNRINKEGIFYSSKEIKAVINRVYGGIEAITRSRLVGIIIIKKQLSFIYSVDDRLIKWEANVEKNIVAWVFKLFQENNNLNCFIEDYQDKKAIILGEKLSIVSKIVVGRKDSKINENKNIENLRSQKSKVLLTAENLAKVFDRAYFTLNKATVSKNFIAYLELSKERLSKFREEYIEKNLEKDFLWLKQLRYCRGRYDGENTAILYGVDLIEWHDCMKTYEKYHYLCPKRYIQQLEKTLTNDKVLSIKDLYYYAKD